MTSITRQRAWVGQQLQHLGGLGMDGSGPHGVGKSLGGTQERDGMARGWSIEDDQVLVSAAFELLDLSQHEDVADSRYRGGDDVQETAGDEPIGDALQSAVRQVIEERIVGRQGSGADTRMGLGGADEFELGVAQSTCVEHRGHRVAVLRSRRREFSNHFATPLWTGPK